MKVNARLGKTLRKQCWAVVVKITYAYTSKEFDDAVNELASILAVVQDWVLLKSNVDYWFNFLFKGGGCDGWVCTLMLQSFSTPLLKKLSICR